MPKMVVELDPMSYADEAAMEGAGLMDDGKSVRGVFKNSEPMVSLGATRSVGRLISASLGKKAE